MEYICDRENSVCVIFFPLILGLFFYSNYITWWNFISNNPNNIFVITCRNFIVNYCTFRKLLWSTEYWKSSLLSSRAQSLALTSFAFWKLFLMTSVVILPRITDIYIVQCNKYVNFFHWIFDFCFFQTDQ